MKQVRLGVIGLGYMGGGHINQGNHQLDLWCWMFGRPQRVRGFCCLGRYHDIEVEDDVTAYFEYANGATAVFISSTGETPGTNRLEIVGDRGKLLMEHDQLAFTQNEASMSEFSRTNPVPNARPAATTHQLPIHGRGGQHAAVLQNFIDAIPTACRSSPPPRKASIRSSWPMRYCIPLSWKKPSSFHSMAPPMNAT